MPMRVRGSWPRLAVGELCGLSPCHPFIPKTTMYRTVACNKSPVQHQCMHHVVCILCCTDHNQYHKTNKDSLCVLSSACSALNFRHIESVLIVFHTLTIFCCCQTQNGYSPVYVASRNGYTEVVDLLVQAGANFHLATTDEVCTCKYTQCPLQ